MKHSQEYLDITGALNRRLLASMQETIEKHHFVCDTTDKYDGSPHVVIWVSQWKTVEGDVRVQASSNLDLNYETVLPNLKSLDVLRSSFKDCTPAEAKQRISTAKEIAKFLFKACKKFADRTFELKLAHFPVELAFTPEGVIVTRLPRFHTLRFYSPREHYRYVNTKTFLEEYVEDMLRLQEQLHQNGFTN